MSQEGSKPRRSPSASGWIGSPWLACGLGLLIAIALAGAILAASLPARFPELWPLLERNYWLVAALAVLAALACGKDVQLAAWRGLRRGRITGDVIVALAADAGLLAGILIRTETGSGIDPRLGIAAFFLAAAVSTAAALGRLLMTTAFDSAPAETPMQSGPVTVPAGAIIPFDGVVIAGRSEVDDGPIGGSPSGSMREAGATVQRGARNGDGVLTIEALIEAPPLAPDFPAAPVFTAAFNTRAVLLPAVMIALAVGIAMTAARVPEARIAIGLLAVAIACPVSLALVRPLILSRARAIAAGHGWVLNGTAALDALTDVNALLIGRAGVVSRSELDIVAIHPALDVEPAELVAAATSLAQSSHGVWASALLRYAVARKLRLAPITEWSDEFHPAGSGLWAKTQGGQLMAAGPRQWLEEAGIRTHFLEEKERETWLPGRKSLWVAQIEPAPFLLGVIVAGERLKPGGAEMCKNAKRFGLTGALLDRRDVEGGAELAKHLGLRLIEDDDLARKAVATEWETLHLRAVIAQHRGDPLPAAPVGPRLLLGVRLSQGGGAIAGGWTAANERTDPRLIMDLLRLAQAARQRARFGTLLAFVFCVPGLWSLTTGQPVAPMATLGALVGIIGVCINAWLLHFTVSTAPEIDEER